MKAVLVKYISKGHWQSETPVKLEQVAFSRSSLTPEKEYATLPTLPRHMALAARISRARSRRLAPLLWSAALI